MNDMNRLALRGPLLLGLLLMGACGDYLPFSGGALSGTLAPSPADWTNVASADIVQLETSPTEPYSVNLWVIGEPDYLYVFGGDNHTQWIQNMEADPNVRLQIDESIYELTAQRVTDAAEFDRFAAAWGTKYGNRPRNENVAETWLMKLTAR